MLVVVFDRWYESVVRWQVVDSPTNQPRGRVKHYSHIHHKSMLAVES